MATKLMTYDDLASVWGVSREAARKKVEGLRLPKQMGNDGKARIMVDLAEVQHQPSKPRRKDNPAGDRAEGEALRLHIQTLQAEIERLATLAVTNRQDFERERTRAETVVAELVKISAKLIQAEEARAENLIDLERVRAEAEEARAETMRVQAELAAWRTRPWWRRALG